MVIALDQMGNINLKAILTEQNKCQVVLGHLHVGPLLFLACEVDVLKYHYYQFSTQEGDGLKSSLLDRFHMHREICIAKPT